MQALPQAVSNPAYSYYVWQLYRNFSYPYFRQPAYPSPYGNERFSSQPAAGTAMKDYGKQPLVSNIEKATEQNETFRTAIWTGEHFQVTVMSIPVGSDIGLEVHPHTDQFIRIEEGQGLVQMGKSKDRLDYQVAAGEGDAIMVPAGTWHNVTNTGDKPLKVYVIYAPPQHPFGTVHPTKADAEAAER
ncbi:Mannose-6-phosphate isomerase, cupin superfamily [Cohnella sp. OV330]|uniref:cupin domain-containing protein n=1 Tax=Cohnella sp. OV330 TaxID=1855288 RepID=UPI0008E9D6A3|nr:cupin domain-containing protein [Cohnella sp. OV330]SFA76234.1 Mannose-6-phosphate isomerase, cupin superfamily [Cohnella sp. OV330]